VVRNSGMDNREISEFEYYLEVNKNADGVDLRIEG
jgi:hypothetical protein